MNFFNCLLDLQRHVLIIKGLLVLQLVWRLGRREVVRGEQVLARLLLLRQLILLELILVTENEGLMSVTSQ